MPRFESRNVKYCNKLRSPRRDRTKPRDPYGLKASLSFTIWIRIYIHECEKGIRGELYNFQ